MSRLMIVEPLPIAAVAASRGSGAMNLATRDPNEVWADTAIGSAATLTIDLGRVQSIDTLFLGHVGGPVAAASWTVTGGVANAGETVIQAATALRVPDVAGDFAETSHALWTGATIAVRYLAISLTQPQGQPLTAGILVIGKAFVTQLGREWGWGRRPIDTGTSTPLSGGGFAVVEGARKLGLAWTYGDLSSDEADQLETIALHLGTTLPVLVIEDASRTPGLVRRLHYGRFDKWSAFERRNRAQTRWEISIERWR